MSSNERYFDFAAASPVFPDVLAAMLPFFTEEYGNPSTIHKKGVFAREAVENARAHVALLLKAHPDEIIFTSGATESVNMAILGVARAYKDKGRHIISTNAEHKATLAALQSEGFEVTLVPVDSTGMVSVKDIGAALREDTILVSVLGVNNEVGTVNPLMEIGKLLDRYRRAMDEAFPLFHADVAQMVPYMQVDVDKLKLDLASFSGNKMGAPKGVGGLFVRRGTLLSPLLFGGSQEHGLRPGTENVPGIVGLGKASEIVRLRSEEVGKRLHEYRKYFAEEILRRIPHARVNGNEKEVAPHIVNVTLKHIDAEELILRLDAEGIYLSAASACTNRVSRSHVLKAMGFTEEEVKNSFRISLGGETTKEGIDHLLAVLEEKVAILRGN